MSLTLKFRTEGPAYERAKAVADAMGLDLDAYLLACVAEGHRVLRTRHLPDVEADQYDEPAYLRRGLSLELGGADDD